MHFSALAAVLVILTTNQLVVAIEIKNGIIGEPEVQCGSNTVEIQFRTAEPFKGKVYVKGHYSDPECRVDYSNAEKKRPTGGIVVHHGGCDMSRQRMIGPTQGMQFSSVVVVSFHPTFITKIDKAFHIKCMYRELTKTVNAGLTVSMLPTESITQSFPMPTCTYTIRSDEIDGEILRYARVGQQVVHRWECNSEVYGILVHSCLIEDGQGQKVEVVDKQGCHKDDYVLGDPTYIESLNMAYREAHVIKFADRVTVRFQCQIRLCMKADGGCEGITPPICNKGARVLAPGSDEIDVHIITTVSPDNNSRTDFPPRSTPTGNNLEVIGERDRPAPLVPDRIPEGFVPLPDSFPTGGDTTEEIVDQPARTPELRLFARRRHRRENNKPDLPEPTKPKGKFNVHVLSFEPVDGDFQSQMIYVLDTTENPETGSATENAALRPFILRGGSVVASNPDALADARNVCLSMATFAILMSSIACVFLAAAFAATIVCFRRLRTGVTIKGNDTSISGSTDTYSSPRASVCSGSQLFNKFMNS